MRHQVHETMITAGEFRGQTIRTPGGDAHPMGSREKIALFNMIMEDVPGATVLDAYAGSGALGIEALSRGATLAIFADNSPIAIKVIEENLKELELNGRGGELMRGDVMKLANKVGEDSKGFRIVLADPPYESYRPEMITCLKKLVSKDGVIVASTPVEAPDIPGMKKVRERKYARAHITIYR